MATARKADQQDSAPIVGQIAFSAEDIQIPRLRIVTTMSEQFKMKQRGEGGLDVGDIYISVDADDPDAEALAHLSKVGTADGGTVKFHVLDMTRHLSARVNGKFEQWQLGDPDAASHAKVAYEYTICVPEFDTFLPVKYTMGGSAAKTAGKVNGDLLRSGRSPWLTTFELSSFIKANGNGDTWAAPAIRLVENDQKSLEVATGMAQSLAPRTVAELPAGSDAPSDF